MSSTTRMLTLVYLAGTLCIYLALELGSRGYNIFYAGSLMVPAFGVALGFIRLGFREERSPRIVVSYIAVSLVVMSAVSLVICLDTRGVPYYWTGIPAILLCFSIIRRFASAIRE